MARSWAAGEGPPGGVLTPVRTVVLDFDGTCTDVEQEAQGFLRAYKQDLATFLGVEDVSPAWEAKEAQVLADPSRYGMVMDGKLVAPPVDLYLLATAVGLLVAPEMDDEQTERLFKDGYRFTSSHFKPETLEVIEALAASDVNFYVVTNSNPDTVGNKLDQLAPAGRDRIQVLGDARKFLVREPEHHPAHPRFEAVPETLSVEAWDRPVYARRGLYFDALQSIWQQTGTSPEETVVVGDVFELDLALPGALGCQVHLAESSRTLDFEKRGVLSFGGRHDPDLRDILAYLG